jgi:hypothetical protein
VPNSQLLTGADSCLVPRPTQSFSEQCTKQHTSSVSSYFELSTPTQQVREQWRSA